MNKPDGDTTSHRIIAIDNAVNAANKLFNVNNLVQMFLTLLNDLQNTQTDEVVPVA